MYALPTFLDPAWQGSHRPTAKHRLMSKKNEAFMWPRPGPRKETWAWKRDLGLYKAQKEGQTLLCPEQAGSFLTILRSVDLEKRPMHAGS